VCVRALVLGEGIHGSSAGLPVCGANFAVLVRELECLHKAQRLVYVAPDLPTGTQHTSFYAKRARAQSSLGVVWSARPHSEGHREVVDSNLTEDAFVRDDEQPSAAA
jgi:hypothetical protein